MNLETTLSTYHQKNILCGYTYFINNQQTTHVTIGFSVADFTPIVRTSVIHFQAVDSVDFTHHLWNLLIENKNYIIDCFDSKHSPITNVILYTDNDDKELSITVDFMTFNNNVCIVLTQKSSTIVLTKSEFSKLVSLNDFFKYTFIYNHSVKYYVAEYCNMYEDVCKKYSRGELDCTWFTQPRDVRPPINYFRLFNELIFYRLQN